mmetsp:Transcript_2111/g.5964  ORF Transcript_2111/g.5964 Transcript_2111/m.5964 type:complete len:235 (+) Transcript_2111:285-989(+)
MDLLARLSASSRASTPTLRISGKTCASMSRTVPLPHPKSRCVRAGPPPASCAAIRADRAAAHAVTRSSVVHRCPARRWMMRQSPTSEHSCSSGESVAAVTSSGVAGGGPLACQPGGLTTTGTEGAASCLRRFCVGGSRPRPEHTGQGLGAAGALVAASPREPASAAAAALLARAAALCAVRCLRFGALHFQHRGPRSSAPTPAKPGALAVRERSRGTSSNSPPPPTSPTSPVGG